MATRQERRLKFLARAYARTMDRLAEHFAALPDHPGADASALDKAVIALAESYAGLMMMPPRQRRAHGRPNARRPKTT